MTDAEFEKLDAKAWRYLERGRRISFKLAGRLVACRDCGRADPENYMLKRDLWLKAVPSGRGCLCVACLAKRLERLGHRLILEDFGDPPDDFVEPPEAH
jgi:hypothetical protein